MNNVVEFKPQLRDPDPDYLFRVEGVAHAYLHFVLVDHRPELAAGLYEALSRVKHGGPPGVWLNGVQAEAVRGIDMVKSRQEISRMWKQFEEGEYL